MLVHVLYEKVMLILLFSAGRQCMPHECIMSSDHDWVNDYNTIIQSQFFRSGEIVFIINC